MKQGRKNQNKILLFPGVGWPSPVAWQYRGFFRGGTLVQTFFKRFSKNIQRIFKKYPKNYEKIPENCQKITKKFMRNF